MRRGCDGSRPAALTLLIAFPLGFIIAELGEPFWRDRPKATQFAGRMLAETLTQRWRERTGTPLTYVGGAIVMGEIRRVPVELRAAGQFAANNVAVYSPDRPRVLLHGEFKISPWIDPADFERRGGVLVWQPRESERDLLPDNIKRAFPRAELQPALMLPRQTLSPGHRDLVQYAIIPPRP